MEDLPEWEIKLEKKDVQKEKEKRIVKDKNKEWIEVDSKQSGLKNRYYKVVSETLNDLESKHDNYLLLNSNRNPLAIVEAKRMTKDPVLGKKQAKQYAIDIKKFTKKKHIENKDFFEASFTNFGVYTSNFLFEESELKYLDFLCNELEKEVFV